MVVVEIKGSPVIDGPFEDFVKTALAHREGIIVYVAVPRHIDEVEIALPLSFLQKSTSYGVGLLLVSDGAVEESKQGVRCSLRFSVPAGRSFGRYKSRVDEAVKKFNRGDNIDGLRDLTETVEAATNDLAIRACSLGLVVPTLEEIEEMDFEQKINLMGAPEWRGRAQKRFLEEDLKDDLKSFKNARNLGHHPRNRQEQQKLERQYMERMEGGVRLVREIIGRQPRESRASSLPAQGVVAEAVRAEEPPVVAGPREAEADVLQEGQTGKVEEQG
jgi:hypothetical protein